MNHVFLNNEVGLDVMWTRLANTRPHQLHMTTVLVLVNSGESTVPDFFSFVTCTYLYNSV